MKTFQNKVVLISGASKGIGRACALAFAEQGAKVALFAPEEKTLAEVDRQLQKIGGKHLVQVLDVNDYNGVNDFLKRVRQQLGKVDVLINNAGFGLVKQFSDTTPADFDAVLQTNFKGAFFLTQQTLKYFNKAANIIFISSIHAEHPSLDPTYDSSKAAINSLVLNLSVALAKKQIRVNAIIPGHIDVQTKARPRPQADVPLGQRAGLPADVAAACLFLADSQSARYITGASLPVTGGLHIPLARDIKL